jgi:hypothetical protein
LAAKQTPDRPKLQHPVLHRSCICDALQMPCDDAIQLKLHSRRTLFYLLFLPLCFIPAFVIQPKNTIRRLVDRRCAARGLSRHSDEIWSFHKGSGFHLDRKSCLYEVGRAEAWDRRVQPENAAGRKSAKCVVSPNHQFSQNLRCLRFHDP